jgi:hypothetical protein
MRHISVEVARQRTAIERLLPLDTGLEQPLSFFLQLSMEARDEVEGRRSEDALGGRRPRRLVDLDARGQRLPANIRRGGRGGFRHEGRITDGRQYSCLRMGVVDQDL